MPAEDRPQICLITPPAPDLATFPDRLAAVLERVPVACLRLTLASQDEQDLGQIADACREVAHARDVAVVIQSHQLIAQRHGLDGVHLPDGARQVRTARKLLGADAIVGAFCGASRHSGITAAEAGADYVAFGPVSGALGDGSLAGEDLFGWWSEMIELPVIAEGGLDESLVSMLANRTDFFAFGPEIWNHDDPAEALARLAGLY